MSESVQQHAMLLDKTDPSGAQEWYCPTCGRRIVLRWSPTHEMIIVEAGDQYASHSGSTGGLRLGAVRVTQPDAERDEISEESLRPWIEAFKDTDFNW